MQISDTPGYVYVLAHPELPAWFKVGRTYRPPHVRAQELSRTAWPSPMEVVHARFFWDSVGAEHQVHQHLGGHRRRREFFDASLPAIREIIQTLPVNQGNASAHHAPATLPWDAPWDHRAADADSWDQDTDRREEEWALGVEEIASGQPALRDLGWRRWMRVSSQGWAEGSRRLAQAIYQDDPTIEGARRASWVFDAAGAQGLSGATLRAAWLRSWGVQQDLQSWSWALRETWRRLASSPWETWPLLVRETLQLERQLCASLPPSEQSSRIQAAQSFGGWDCLPPFSDLDVT